MAAPNFVVVRRTISQTIVPYKDVDEKLLKRLNSKRGSQQRLGTSSTNSVAHLSDETQWQGSKKGSFNSRQNILERSRSEVCLGRKSSYARETSLDVYEERREEGLIKPIPRRKERDTNSQRRPNTRPQSDFFPEFYVSCKKNVGLVGKKEPQDGPEQRLGQCITTLRREIMSLRNQDRELLKQLMTLNEHIKDLKELSETQGELFVSSEDKRDIQECPNASPTKIRAKEKTSVQRSNSMPVSAGLNSPRKGKCGSGDSITRTSVIENSPESKTGGGASAGRLEETSFEYVEETGNNSVEQAHKMSIPKKNTKLLRPAASFSVARKTSLRLERKSVSCQFLNSDNAKKKRDLFSEHTKSLEPARISENKEECGTLESKQKSLSLSHLKRGLKSTEGSTSDSECSTSGCYGGSSTGSDMEVERSAIIYGDISTDEETDKKAFEREAKLVKTLRTYQAVITKQPSQFRKKIVSV